MRKQVIKCDKCGKNISPDVVYAENTSHIKFALNYWHGGSIGGEEDIDRFELDLCDDCSRELSYLIKEWIKEKKRKK